ncbi:hypothetical protein [Agaribacterium haliotis]|uniref:3'-5' exonuclease n=1 Tax=Agaribacterium haliotis TaxID=2013869 RepID=UPI000BB58F4F|nr:hypothetical protein [Agaribacterium haliotis]
MNEQRCPNIVDIEASGFGNLSYPVEIGIAKSTGERYCALIKPEAHWTYWSDSAEQLHGISRDVLLQRGKPAKQVCHEINAFLGRSQVFSDALAHDQSWLNKLFNTMRVNQSFKLRAIEHIMLEEQFNVWDKVKSELEHKLQMVRHRASSDALLIQQTYLCSRQAANSPAA